MKHRLFDFFCSLGERWFERSLSCKRLVAISFWLYAGKLARAIAGWLA